MLKVVVVVEVVVVVVAEESEEYTESWDSSVGIVTGCRPWWSTFDLWQRQKIFL
jgi:hypothetical protein